jgi:hypothetical protein
MTKLFECFWGDGYRGDTNQSLLELKTIEFFNNDRGYSDEDIAEIFELPLGDYAEFKEAGDHWVRRIV